jgi:DNA-binding XRE family transcriptional regulator
MEALMARTIDAVIAALPEAEREAIAARAHELIAEEMSLQAIRKAMGKTQVAVAKRLKLRQDAVSKIETRADMLISTLRSYVKAVGGELELVATFPDRPPVRLGELGALAPERKREKRAAHSHAVAARS